MFYKIEKCKLYYLRVLMGLEEKAALLSNSHPPPNLDCLRNKENLTILQVVRLLFYVHEFDNGR